MTTPNRAARKRAARAQAAAMQQDPAFAEAVAAQNREQAITGLVQQHESAMAAIGELTAALKVRTAERDQFFQAAQTVNAENEGLLADLEASDVDIGDLVDMVRLLLDDVDANRPAALELIERVIPPEPETPALAAVPDSSSPKRKPRKATAGGS
jgi:hypothetical protein